MRVYTVIRTNVRTYFVEQVGNWPSEVYREVELRGERVLSVVSGLPRGDYEG